MKSAQDLPFALLRWIKEQQAIEAAHRARMVVRNYKEDASFVEYVSVIASKCWPKLKTYEKTLMMNLVERHKSHYNLSPAQRSAIIGIYMKHGGKW